MKYSKIIKCKNCNKFLKEKNTDKVGKCKYLLKSDKKDRELKENEACIFMIVRNWEEI